MGREWRCRHHLQRSVLPCFISRDKRATRTQNQCHTHIHRYTHTHTHTISDSHTHTHTETELNESSYASLTNLAVLIQFGCWPMGWRNCCVSKRFISLYEYYCRAPPDQETELVQS